VKRLATANWIPTVHSDTTVDLPVVIRHYRQEEFEEWKLAQPKWQASGKVDTSVWGKYAKLVKTGRFRFPNGGQASYGFGEFHTALALERLGWMCWRPRLFDYGKPMVQGFAKVNTDDVRELWQKTLNAPWPADIQLCLRLQPRSPDLVAYHRSEDRWLFCEIKRNKDRTTPAQLTGLAVLHLLTGASVAIIKVLPSGRVTSTEPCSVRIDYRNGADLGWIRRTNRRDLR